MGTLVPYSSALRRVRLIRILGTYMRLLSGQGILENILNKKHKSLKFDAKIWQILVNGPAPISGY